MVAISVKSPAHLQMVGDVLVKCELFLTALVEFFVPTKHYEVHLVQLF